MDGMLFVIVALGVAIAGIAIYARHAARKSRIDHNAMTHIRLNGRGQAIDNETWPGRDKNPHQ